MINAKEVGQFLTKFSRDLGLRQGTAWSIQQRIRAAMAMDPEQKALFHPRLMRLTSEAAQA